MTMNQNELLSALVDGELQGDELAQALSILNSDEQAKMQFQRYQQSSDVLQGYAERGLSGSLISRISAELENEPEFSQQETKKKAAIITFPKPLWKQMTGLAVAASVGALAVIGVVNQPQDDLPVNTPVAVVDNANIITVAKTGARWTVDEPEVENRLNSYLLEHNEHTSSSGVFSYARVVSYGAE